MSSHDVDIRGTQQAWMEWVDRVSPEKREAMRKALAKYKTTTFEGMAGFLAELFGQVILGDLPPVMVEPALRIVRELQTTLWMMHSQNGTQHLVGNSIRQLTMSLKEIRPVQPTYTISNREALQIPDAPEAPELEEDILEANSD